MSQLSPAITLLWAVLSIMELCFLFYHLYQFDGFQCLKWTSSKGQQGAFKRMLTYGYMLSIPLMIIFSVATTSLKYYHGYILLPNGSVVPTPTNLWSPHYQSMAKSLYIVLAITWSLEMTSHLEELNFWLFLLTTTAEARPWLQSSYFVAWCVGSTIAIIGMPLVAAFSGGPDRAEACVFVAGSVGSGLITVISLLISWMFPGFLRKIAREGAERDVIARLSSYNELNNVRVIFRFIFVVPMMVLGIRGLQQLAPAGFFTDLMAMLSAVGVAVSSAVTLLIFFPRASPIGTTAARRDSFVDLQSEMQSQSQSSQTPTPTPTQTRSQSRLSMREHSRSMDIFRRSDSPFGLPIDYPPPTLDPRRSGVLKNSNSFEYEVTVERYDDAGRAVLLRKSARAVEDMPYEDMRAGGWRYARSEA